MALKRSTIRLVIGGVSILQENNLLTCLETGMKPNVSPQTRQRIVSKTPEFRMLDKPWKSLLLCALYEVNIPNDDEDNSPSQMVRQRSTSRSRRGVGTNIGPLQWLPETNEVLIANSESNSFRLAVLLLRKSLFADDWDESNDEIIEDLRNECSSSGVHQVWHKVAESIPILAQFISFPISESTEEISDYVDSGAAFIDPSDSKNLAKTLEILEQGISEASVKIAIQKAKAQLNGKRGLRDIGGLESLEGESSVISALLNIHLGNDATKNLKELKKTNSKLSEALTDLVQLRSGVAKNWSKSCLLYTSPSPRDKRQCRMPSSA